MNTEESLAESKKKLLLSLKSRGISSDVLSAIAAVPREKFVSSNLQHLAYEDYAMPIAAGQTISQPYIVAFMTHAITEDFKPKKVLEIGTGSGYQAAVLAHLVAKVYSIERVESLYHSAKQRLEQLKIKNVEIFYGDGTLGLPEYAPYDAIIVTARSEQIHPNWIKQLADPGRLLLPITISPEYQTLRMIEIRNGKQTEKDFFAVSFVPLVAGKG